MSLIVYGEFVGPECYLASRRVDALAAAGVDVDWRAVEPRPGLGMSAERLTDADRAALADRLAELDDLLVPGERLPRRAPAFRPHAGAAVSAYAEAYGAGVDADVRRLLFELYWRRGVDIGSPAALREPLTGPILRGSAAAYPLRESGYAVSVAGGPVTTDAYARIRSWRSQWMELGEPELPVLFAGAARLSGTDALRRLGKEIGYAGADPDPDLADPMRYPSLTVRPGMSWLSQIGGPWSYAYCRPDSL